MLLNLWSEAERVIGRKVDSKQERGFQAALTRVSARMRRNGIEITKQGRHKPSHFDSAHREEVESLIRSEMGQAQPPSDAETLLSTLDKVMANYLERNPNLKERTQKARRDQITYLSKLFLGPMSEITEEQVADYAKKKSEISHRATVMQDLRALEDCFLAGEVDPRPVSAVLDGMRRKRGGARNVGKPDYIRGKGYKGSSYERFEPPGDAKSPVQEKPAKATMPLQKENWMKATIIDSQHERVEVEGDCVSSVLMESIIEIDRRVKQDPTQRTFILLLGER